ncbi:hypothetical protein BJ742DRAFT_836237 [Cladochytrium replicatum]|nr:hypothetical protein BJ742DRAFT_836237 [Cladochytrium replicatum]
MLSYILVHSRALWLSRFKVQMLSAAYLAAAMIQSSVQTQDNVSLTLSGKIHETRSVCYILWCVLRRSDEVGSRALNSGMKVHNPFVFESLDRIFFEKSNYFSFYLTAYFHRYE